MPEPAQINAQQVLANFPSGGIKGRNLSIPTVNGRGILIKESIYELKWDGRDYKRGDLKGEIEWALSVKRLGSGKYSLTDRNGSKFTVNQWVVQPPGGGQPVTHAKAVLENAFVDGVRGDYRITAYGVTDHQVRFSYSITVSQRR
ncbi:MAG: hypothetical protein ACPGVU_15945 [Limisphaerales bacterium]